MFLGHYAVALAAKRAAPRASLGALVLAAQWADLLWPALLLTGTERVAITGGANPFLVLTFTHYPVSHSLLADVGWGVAGGLLTWALTRDRRAALVVGLVVVSHWVLDFVTHRPDLPLVPGGAARVGLGLWYSPVATIVVELAMWVAGVALYVRATRARDRIGAAGFWALVTFLTVIYVLSFTGAPPPSVHALALVTLATWLFPLWAWWVDRHRVPAGAGS
ncbi:MAG TPA: hypothetical protein VFS40_01880 [Gemmatimonadales bacterium]|nr:hypothetical protein [Gemmatimonadales bacterium]